MKYTLWYWYQTNFCHTILHFLHFRVTQPHNISKIVATGHIKTDGYDLGLNQYNGYDIIQVLVFLTKKVAICRTCYLELVSSEMKPPNWRNFRTCKFKNGKINDLSHSVCCCIKKIMWTAKLNMNWILILTYIWTLLLINPIASISLSIILHCFDKIWSTNSK